LNATNLSSGTVPIARLGDSGTKSGTTFLAGDNTFKTVTVAINSIANDGANRILTSDGDGTATAEANCTFDGGRFITKQGDSDIGMLVQNTSHDSQLRIETVAANKNSVIMFADGDDGDVGMIDYDHNDNSLGFTVNTSERLLIDNSGQVLPGSDNAQNLGSSSKRWANIYSADIHCSNKGSKNDVDGTWGDFTIQEGESDLFLINNRSGKKYKFNLTEVN
jgi:hypothetical protein